MKTQELELFLALAETANQSRAASQVAVSQPRASQMLRSLEAELGCALFERSAGGLKATGPALAFVPFAEAILLKRKEGILAAQEACETLSGSLRVGVSHTLSAFAVPRILADFHREYPRISLKITKSVPPELVSLLEADKVDVCLCFEPPRIVPWVWTPLFSTDMVGVSAASTDLPDTLLLEDFVKAPLVLPSRACSTRLVVDAELHKLGIVPDITMEVDDATGLLSMVKRGLARTIIPRTMAIRSRSTRLTELRKPRIIVTAGFLCPRAQSKSSTAFMQLGRNMIDRHGAAELGLAQIHRS